MRECTVKMPFTLALGEPYTIALKIGKDSDQNTILEMSLVDKVLSDEPNVVIAKLRSAIDQIEKQLYPATLSI